MSTFRVLAALRAYDTSSDGARFTSTRRLLEKEIVRRQAFESSAAVRTILQQGEALAMETSVDLWATPWQ
eukprot:5069634-Prymnesium_polylepis.2